MTRVSHATIALALLSARALSAPPARPAKIAVLLGPEEYVLGPGSAPMDNPMSTLRTEAGLRLYSANGTTLVYGIPQLAAPLSVVPTVALAPGAPGSFDECGSWLQSALPEPGTTSILGWYHAESGCDYSAGVTHKSMAFARSADGGLTWSKPGYPANQILTADSNVGDGRVVAAGGYYYLFFWSEDDWGVHVARSRSGLPGTWVKYYAGSFSEPGLGGRSSKLSSALLSTSVAWSSYLGRYIAIPVFGRWGFGLDLSDGQNLLSWASFAQGTIYPAVGDPNDSTVDQGYGRDAASKAYYNYGSLIALDGGPDVGQACYLYYVKLFPGEGFDRRYQFRRRITFGATSSTYVARVALSQYAGLGGRSRVSSEAARPSEGYVYQRDLGSVLAYQASGFRSLYECFSPGTATYFLSIADPALFAWQHCESGADTFVRRIGYVSARPGAEASLPLYGGQKLLGYIFP